MPMNLQMDTSDLERVERPLPRLAPPLDLQPQKSPYYIGQLPTTANVNPDAVRNFTTPGIPSYRITPAAPLNVAGSVVNAVAGATITPTILQPTPAPTISSPLATIPTGYQFSFLQVRLPLGSTATINSYKIYRASTNNSALAVVIQSIPHHPANVGVPVLVQDAVTNGVIMFYWVSAINISGIESTLTPAQSGAVVSKAGFSATSQLASSFNGLPTNTTFGCTNATTLSNTGSSPNIAISANQNLYGPGFLSYNSGSIALGSFLKIYVFANDLNFQGGAVPYSFAFLNFSISGDGSIPLGAIATVSGTATTGGGNSGGSTPNGAGGRGLLPA